MSPDIRRYTQAPNELASKQNLYLARNIETDLREAYKAVAPGTAGVLVGDDDGLDDLPELLEVAPHRVALRLPREAPHEQLRECRVAVHGSPRWPRRRWWRQMGGNCINVLANGWMSELG